MNRPAAEDVFNALLSAVPQGVVLAVIWIAYSLWISLTMRRLAAVWRPRQFSAFVSTFRPSRDSKAQI
jgi:hypothetical protein